MSRNTLPDFDALAQLGIGMPAPREVATPRTSARPERLAKQVIAPKVDPVPKVAIEPNGSHAEPVPRPEPSQGASPQAAEAPPVAVLAPAAPTPAPPPPVRTVAELRPSKAKTSARVPAALWDEVRACVVWHGHTMTIDRFTEEAFREHLRRLRRQHALGDRFPARELEPKQGRRVS